MTAEANNNAASLAFKKALIERALAGEMNHHLGYPRGVVKPADVANQRNDKGAETVLTGEGPVRIEVPRDRDGSFAPLLIPEHERRLGSGQMRRSTPLAGPPGTLNQANDRDSTCISEISEFQTG